ncbi:MAG: hypothetical protein R3326_08870, partial [Gemmatimonadota bacterium]|nr:hypothetical protein [Gemmatimonadota bacterium]
RLTPRDRTGSRRRTRRVRSLVQALFGQRRKQLQKSLRTLSPWALGHDDVNRVEQATWIDLRRRPETLSIYEWLTLSDALVGLDSGQADRSPCD